MFDGIGSGRRERTFWSTLFDNDWHQRADIDDLSERTSTLARELAADHDSLSSQVRVLEQRVAELTLVSRTLLAVLLEAGAITEEAFNYQLRTFDLEDGRLDNR